MGTDRTLDNSDRTNDMAQDGTVAGWQNTLEPNSEISITYQANMYNADTGVLIPDGSSVTVGTKVRFAPKAYQNADISWFGTGRSNDSPNGHWVANAAGPSASCSAQDFVNDYTTILDDVYSVYIPLSVNPPSNNVSVSGTASVNNLGGGVYEISGPGSVSASITFNSTYAKFYARYRDHRSGTTCVDIFGEPFCTTYVAGCYGDNTPMRTGWFTDGGCLLENTYAPLYCGGSVPGSPYQLSVPAQTITFNLTATPAVPANTPPTVSVSGPTSGTVNIPYSFDFTANDPENHQIQYGVDWDNNGSVDQGNPYGAAMNSGQTLSMSRTWSTPGTYTFRYWATDVNGAASGDNTHTITIAAAPPITADLTINGSNGPIDVAKNTTVNLNWTSANAATCSKWGGAWGSGQTISLSGSDSTVVNTTTTYMVNCSGVTDSVTVNVVNQTPNAPTVAYVTGTRETGETLTFNIRGTDPDNDNIFYEIDWDNNGTVDATTMTVPSGNTQNANHSWSAAGTVTFRARTVDTAGAVSGWTTHSETITLPPPPTTTFEIRVNSDAWRSSKPAPVDTNDTLQLRWDSTGATSCSGTNFNTSGATSNNSTGVTTPSPGSSIVFTLSCTGAGGTDTKSITVTAGLPNFNRPIATHGLSATFDPTTGAYDYVSISFQTTNNGVSGTTNTATYSLGLDSRSPITGSIPLLTRGSVSPNFTHTINTIPFGAHTATIVVDNGTDVTESNEGDNIYVYDFGGIIPPPDPQLTITADKVLLRNEETTTIHWSTVATYPTLSCRVVGPGVNIDPAPLTGSQPTQPISAKSEFIFSCRETTTNTTWSDSVTVETVGVVEEV